MEMGFATAESKLMTFLTGPIMKLFFQYQHNIKNLPWKYKKVRQRERLRV